MANITASAVNELRQATGCGLMDCKKALVECEGDLDSNVHCSTAAQGKQGWEQRREIQIKKKTETIPEKD